jgi:formylglycine-generating enzyme required for sulfatase activity
MRSKPILSLLALLLAVPLFAADRTALLIANSDYGEHQLPEAKANVAKLAKALEQAGFSVTVKENIEKDFRRELEAFLPTCPNGGVSLVYYCGYGSRYDRKLSRMIEKPDGEKEKEYYYEPDSGIWSTKGNTPYRIDDLVREFRMRSHARLNLLVLDCAYKYPKAKASQQGLAAIDPKTWPGGMVCYAVPPGKTLPAGTSSALAESLARHLTARDQPLGEVMARVKADVVKQSGGKQEIWSRFSLPKNATAHVVSSRKRKIATTKLPPSNPKPGDEWINSLGMVFCWCPPGKFRMGIDGPPTPQTRDAAPVDVTIRKGFWMSKYEVALGDYSRARYGRTKPLRGPSGFIPFNVCNAPLTTIEPSGVSGFTKNLNAAESKAGMLPKGWNYRLPTEAEWEYACRAGSGGRYSFGSSPMELARFANFADAELLSQDSDFYYSDRNSNDGTGKRPAPIGSYEPNAWGIHDMHGNVNEICADGYLNELPGGLDPWVQRIKEGNVVIRGGAWSSTPEYCQAGFRNSAGHKDKSGEFANVGLRVILSSRELAEKK